MVKTTECSSLLVLALYTVRSSVKAMMESADEVLVDPEQALEYADKLKAKLGDWENLFICMRSYPGKLVFTHLHLFRALILANLVQKSQGQQSDGKVVLT